MSEIPEEEADRGCSRPLTLVNWQTAKRGWNIVPTVAAHYVAQKVREQGTAVANLGWDSILNVPLCQAESTPSTVITIAPPSFVTTDSRSGVSSSTATSSTTSSSMQGRHRDCCKKFGETSSVVVPTTMVVKQNTSTAKFRNQESLITKESMLDDSIGGCNPSNFQTSTPRNDPVTNKLREELVFLQRTRKHAREKLSSTTARMLDNIFADSTARTTELCLNEKDYLRESIQRRRKEIEFIWSLEKGSIQEMGMTEISVVKVEKGESKPVSDPTLEVKPRRGAEFPERNMSIWWNKIDRWRNKIRIYKNTVDAANIHGV